MNDLLNCLNIFSIFLSITFPKQSTCEFICSNNQYEINCIQTSIVTGVYGVEDCSDTSNKKYILSSSNESCIGRSSCKLNNMIQSSVFIYECSGSDKIYRRELKNDLDIFSPMFFSSSDNLSLIPQLSNSETITHCNLTNKEAFAINVQMTIPMISLSNFQLLNVYTNSVNNFRHLIYDKASIYKSMQLINESFVLYPAEALTILYLNNATISGPNSGKLLIKFSFEYKLTRICDNIIPINIPKTTRPWSVITTSKSTLKEFSISNTLNSNSYTIYTTPSYVNEKIKNLNVLNADGNLNKGEIAGIIIGVIAALVVIILIIAGAVKVFRKKLLALKTANTKSPSIATKSVPDIGINSEYSEYQQPSPAHLQGSDISGSFVFEQKVADSGPIEDSKLSDTRKKKKKKTPDFIQSNPDARVNPSFRNQRPNNAVEINDLFKVSALNGCSIGTSRKYGGAVEYSTSSYDITLEDNSLYSTQPPIHATLSQQNIIEKAVGRGSDLCGSETDNFATSDADLRIEENGVYSYENSGLYETIKKSDSNARSFGGARLTLLYSQMAFDRKSGSEIIGTEDGGDLRSDVDHQNLKES